MSLGGLWSKPIYTVYRLSAAALPPQDYVLPEVRDRQFLISFYKFARRQGMDVSRYNALRDELFEIEEELRRLRDPLQKHLPVRELGAPCKEDDEQQQAS